MSSFWVTVLLKDMPQGVSSVAFIITAHLYDHLASKINLTAAGVKCMCGDLKRSHHFIIVKITFSGTLGINELSLYDHLASKINLTAAGVKCMCGDLKMSHHFIIVKITFSGTLGINELSLVRFSIAGRFLSRA